MFSGLSDFGKQRTLKQALGFALCWIIVQIIFNAAIGVLWGSLIILMLHSTHNIVLGSALLPMCGVFLVPTLVSLLTVRRKWGSGNAALVVLYVLAVLSAIASLGLLLTFIVYVLLAMRPNGKTASTGIFTLLIPSLLLLPIALLILTGLHANKANIKLGRTDSSYEIKVRNIQRKGDLSTIVFAVDQYAIDHKEVIDKIPNSDIEICRPHATDCVGMLDLAALLEDYPIPVDPLASKEGKGTRYTIHKAKRVKANEYDLDYIFTTTALDAEGGEKLVFNF